jgi:hypothetical protein
MPIAFVRSRPPAVARRPLTENDAIDIWIARWLRVTRKEIVNRYGCDPRRIYEIWEGERFPGSRAKALAVFEARFPGLAGQTDVSRHRRIPSRSTHPDQLSLFE